MLGRALEQENVDWLEEILREGHPVGNHTYDHVRLTARKPERLQHRFARAPWLIHGRSVQEAIVENIRMTELAMQERLRVKPAGFRTPYGFPRGLAGRRDLQEMLLALGFTWVSSLYCQPRDLKKSKPTAADFAAVTRFQRKSQPFVYPSGLVEVPTAPLSDCNAFRTRKWKLDEYLKMIEKSAQWAIEHRAVYNFGAHPSVMVVEDPEFRAIDLVCELVQRAGKRAALVDLDAIAERARLRHRRKTS